MQSLPPQGKLNWSDTGTTKEVLIHMDHSVKVMHFQWGHVWPLVSLDVSR